MSNEKLQPGDYTTRVEINAYAEREGIEPKEAYQRICDAFIAAGADKGESESNYYTGGLSVIGWGESGVFYAYDVKGSTFTRHLTPDQILSAGNQEDLQSEKQAEGVAPKQIGELTLEVELTTDLQATIHDYIYLLNKTYDQKARELIENQLVDLMDLEYQQLTGENNA